MKYFLYLAALLLGLSGCILAVSCSTSRPSADTSPLTTPLTIGGLIPRDSTGKRVDSIVVEPHRSLVDKVLGREPTSKKVLISSKSTPEISRLSVGKKATVQVFYAPATVTNAAKKATILGDGAVLAEKKATAAKADSGATVQVSASQKGPATTAGRDAAVSLPATPSWLDNLTGPLGYVVGAVVLLLFLAYCGPLLLAAFRRKKDEQA